MAAGKQLTCFLLLLCCSVFTCLILTAAFILLILAEKDSHDLKNDLGDLKGQVRNAALMSAALSADTLPYKYAPRFDQPHTTQGNRGTCWAHGLVAGLAHSYRKNGIEKGFLKENEYVPFSVQAWSISMIQTCQKPEYNETVCRELQAGPEINSTSGGEVAWLYYMPELYTQFFPLSMCPYLDEDEDEWTCPDLEAAVAANNNPVRFNIVGMETAYTNIDAKKAVYKTGLASPYSVDVWVNVYYIPCQAGTDDEAYSSICKEVTEDQLEPCPNYVSKISPDDKCVAYRQPGYNMDGEFYQTTPYEVEGGHCMLIQGWNDEYVTRQGDKGGFPIKNSWYDRAYDFNLETGASRGGRGSHSLQYLMSEISEAQERMICPNIQNPDNWLSCTEYSEQTGDTPNIDFCLNKTQMDNEVKWERRPMQFQKLAGEGETPDTHYYLDKLTHHADGLATISLIHTDENGQYIETVTLRHVPVDWIAIRYQPIDEQAEWLQNDDENCGLYWMPYSANQNTARDNEAWNGAFFDIVWDDSSYLVNKDKYPQYDYKYLEKSQTTRNTWDWEGPSARARPADTNPKVES